MDFVRLLLEPRSEEIEVRFDEAPDDFSGMLFTKSDKVYILINEHHHPNRQRFTIAHELGHFALHVDDQLSLFVDESTIYFRDGKSALAIDSSEIEANAFAAELLIPRELLISDLHGQRLDISGDERELRKMAQRYQVSTQSLTLRLSKLGLVAGF